LRFIDVSKEAAVADPAEFDVAFPYWELGRRVVAKVLGFLGRHRGILSRSRPFHSTEVEPVAASGDGRWDELAHAVQDVALCGGS
jgi:hypothetical protein